MNDFEQDGGAFGDASASVDAARARDRSDRTGAPEFDGASDHIAGERGNLVGNALAVLHLGSDGAVEIDRLGEGTPGGAAARLAAHDPEGGPVTFAVDDPRFEIAGDLLRLRPGAVLDAEAEPAVTLAVTATDAAGNATSRSLTLPVADLDEAPVDITIAAKDIPAGDLVLWLDGQDQDGDDAPDAVGNRGSDAWVDKSGLGSTGTLQGDTPVVTETGIDFSETSRGYRISGNPDVNRGTFPEKSFALSFETGDDISGTQIIYEQGGTVRGYSLVIAPDPASGAPKLWGFAYNESEWEHAHRHKVLDFGAVEPDTFYSVAMVHDARAVDLADRTFTGYLNGEQVVRQTHVDVQYNHPDAVGVGNINGGTVLATTQKDFNGAAPFEGTISEIVSWNRVLDSAEIQKLTGHFEANKTQLADTVAAFETAGAGDVIATLGAIDPDVGDTVTFELVPDTPGAALFEIVGDQLRVRDGGLLDFETATEHALEVRAIDSAGLSRVETLTVSVLDVNEAPTGIALDVSEVPDTLGGGATLGRLTAVDPEGSSEFFFEIIGHSDRAIEHPLLEIEGDLLRLREGAVLDVADATAHTLNVHVIDAGGAVGYGTISFDVVDGNAAPTDLAVEAGMVVVGDAGATVGTVAVADPDAGDVHSFTLSDNRFEVRDGALSLRPDAALGHDDLDGLSVDITATDRFGESYTETVEIGVAESLPVTVATGFQVDTLPPGNPNAALAARDWSGTAFTSAVVTALDGGTGYPVPPGGGPAGYRVQGIVEVTTDGVHTFVTPTTGETRLRIDGVEVETGAVDLAPGRHVVEMLHLTDGPGAPPPSLSWQTPGAAAPTPVAASDALSVAGDGSIPLSLDIGTPAGLKSGFEATFFEQDGPLDTLDDVDWSGPADHSETVAALDYGKTPDSFWQDGASDHFAGRFTGSLEVVEGGTYRFDLGSDDGTRLRIDGVEVIENDGLHPHREQSVEIELDPGQHIIEVDYFENVGHASLTLNYAGPDTGGQAQRLSGAPEPATETVALVGLPDNTLVASGSDAALVDGGQVDVTGWDLDSLTLSPPHGSSGPMEFAVQITRGTGDGARTLLSEPVSITVEPAAGDPPPEEPAAEDLEMPAPDAGGWADMEAGDPDPDGDGDGVMAEEIIASGAGPGEEAAMVDMPEMAEI